MAQKIIKVGNSAAVTIPSEFLKQVGLKPGDSLFVEQDVDAGVLKLSTKNIPKSKSSVTPDFLEVVAKVTKRYDKAFRDLATK